MSKSITSAICSFLLIASFNAIAHSEDLLTNEHPLIRWNVELENASTTFVGFCQPPQQKQGLLVKRIGKDFGGPVGLQPGDVILRVDGQSIRSIDDLPEQDPSELVVVRDRRLTRLGVNALSVPGAFNWAKLQATLRAQNKSRPMMPCMTFPGGPGMPFPIHQGAGVSASSFAGGNESVSVSQSGDQISIEMSLPSRHSENLRFHGTHSQIEQEVLSSDLPDAAKQRVFDAIK